MAKPRGSPMAHKVSKLPHILRNELWNLKSFLIKRYKNSMRDSRCRRFNPYSEAMAFSCFDKKKIKLPVIRREIAKMSISLKVQVSISRNLNLISHTLTIKSGIKFHLKNLYMQKTRATCQ